MHKANRILPFILVCFATGLFTGPVCSDSTQQPLSLSEFIQTASKNDSSFEAILLDQLPLQYRRAIILPDSDFIASIKQQLHLLTGQGLVADTRLSVAKLFPDSGTDVSVSYTKPATSTGSNDASLQLLLSQPIARNAYGKGSRIADKIIGIENEISRYQIIEAYEDYFASLTLAWYNWYSVYENLKVSRASYQSTQKLLENILQRQKQKIALPIDVNKMKLSLINKKENIIVLQEIYDSISNLIFNAMRYTGTDILVPAGPASLPSPIDFESDYENFTRTSRTYLMLKLLEEQGTMEVKKAADDLLPSTNLLIGYQLDSEAWGLREQENNFFAGISLNWPIGHHVDKAKYEITRIQHKKTRLSNLNKYEELHTNLKNLHLQIKRESNLIEVAEQKIKLAESILKDESVNYSYGKVSLNDYITAVNHVDENRFSQTEHAVQLNRLTVEWLRLTDKLVENDAVAKTEN